MADKVRHGLNVKPVEHFWDVVTSRNRECLRCGDVGNVNALGLCEDCRNDPAVRDEYLKD